MRHHRMLILLFAATLVTATALAFTSAARAEDAIVKLGIVHGSTSLRTGRKSAKVRGPGAEAWVSLQPVYSSAHFSPSGLNTLVVSHSGRLSASATRRASAAT